LHIELHREVTTVVYFDFAHGVEIEFKSFQLKEKHVGKALDGAPFESVALEVTLLAEISVVSF
jgi:hypothetical protein